MYIDRLNDLRKTLKESEFFNNHEVWNRRKLLTLFSLQSFLFSKMIGSSLLFIHDNNRATIGIIDFGKTRMLPKHIQINHTSQWVDGNHEDGYLIGIDNLIDIFEEVFVQASGEDVNAN